MNTLLDLLDTLQRQDHTHSLVFETADGAISPGYHVTELRYSTSKGVDCGGMIETWSEARLQLLDGHGQTHMSVGKFCSIATKCLAAIPELASASLMVEFGHDNAELRIMSLHHPERRGTRVVVGLGNSRAVCKPAQKSELESGGSEACCGHDQTAAKTSSYSSPDGLRENASPCCA
ncbi:DUF6428 family protein [Yoonia sp. BS5-3]|uniref:DUF6428 family protein n=1 Tax=Yoonia phaeophyticola TaxID=3137369 RepID=A0ABZ2V7N8_9RHOB